jgi:hypothetical protein
VAGVLPLEEEESLRGEGAVEKEKILQEEEEVQM